MLGAEAVERYGDQIVLAHREDHVHELIGLVALGERLPGGVRHDSVPAKLVGRPDQRGLEGAPAGGGGSVDDALDVGVAETGAPADHDVLGTGWTWALPKQQMLEI